MSSNSSENIMDELSIILMDIDKTDKLTDNKIKTILNNLNKVEQKNKKSMSENVDLLIAKGVLLAMSKYLLQKVKKQKQKKNKKSKRKNVKIKNNKSKKQ